jgi:hypothetical protein
LATEILSLLLLKTQASEVQLMIMLQTALVIKENRRLNKMTVQTLILVTLVSMMGTTMPQTTQNDLSNHHHRRHSMYETVRTMRILVTLVSMMGTTMPQTTQNNLMTHHHHHRHSMYETVRTMRILVTSVSMMGTTMPQTTQNT